MSRQRNFTGLFLFFIIIGGCTPVKKAREFYNTGQYEQAIIQCRAALATDSTNVTALTMAGQSWLALKQPDSALVYFQKGMSFDSANVFFAEKIALIHVQAGDEMLSAKNYKQAIDKYQLALHYQINVNAIQEKIADAWYQSGSIEKAMQVYSLIQNSNDSTRISQKIQIIRDLQSTADLYLQTGRDYLKQKKYKAAKQQFFKALEIAPDNFEAKYYFHIASAMPMYRKGSVSSLWDAIAEFGIASAILPDRGEPHYFMAMAYNKKDKNEYSNAISEFELAIQVEPNGQYAAESKRKIAELKARRKKMRDFLSW